MNQDERDDLWELLGRARPAKVSPFFARNVLRAIRVGDEVRPGLLGWLRVRWTIAAIGACAVMGAGFILWPRPEPTPPVQDSPVELAEVLVESPDYAVIGNLDELLAAEESSAWLRSSAN